MSTSIVRQYVDAVGSLQRREAVHVQLPNGVIVSAVPEEIEFEGRKLMQLHVLVDGKSGPIEAQLRMSPETYEKSLIKAESFTPRLAMVQRRMLLLEKRNGE
jgi:hypothetical protein